MTPRIYEEVVNLIASGPTPAQVIDFKPTEQTKKRFWDLAERNAVFLAGGYP